MREIIKIRLLGLFVPIVDPALPQNEVIQLESQLKEFFNLAEKWHFSNFLDSPVSDSDQLQ